MTEIDAFASSLLEEAKRFLELAGEAKGNAGETPFLHAALMLGFCSLEAHVNALAADMTLRTDLSPHVLAMLEEKDVRMEKGEFVVDKKLKIYRLEDRILLLHRLGPKPDVDGKWRGALSGALDLRNKLTHPKAVAAVKHGDVTRALQAVIDTIDALYGAYKKKFPAAQRQLISTLDF